MMKGVMRWPKCNTKKRAVLQISSLMESGGGSLWLELSHGVAIIDSRKRKILFESIRELLFHEAVNRNYSSYKNAAIELQYCCTIPSESYINHTSWNP